MNALPIVVVFEVDELSLKILSIPKEDVVKVFTTDRSNQSLNERM